MKKYAVILMILGVLLGAKPERKQNHEVGIAKTTQTKLLSKSYSEAVQKVLLDGDSLYEITDTEIISRDKNKVKLRTKNAAGTSIYVAEEKNIIDKDKALFEIKMVEKISGTLSSQFTKIVILNENDKAKITIEMEARVDAFLAGEKIIKKNLDSNIEKMIREVEKVN